MMRRAVVVSLAVLGLAAWPEFARAQAAAEYAISAGRSTAMGAKAGATLGKKLDRATAQIRDRITSSTSRSTNSKARSASAAPRSAVEDNRVALEKEAEGAGAILRIDSVPEKAQVYVDGVTVAFTPAELKIPEGDHTIEVTRGGFSPWQKEITVAKDETINLKAELQDRYKSAVTLSLD